MRGADREGRVAAGRAPWGSGSHAQAPRSTCPVLWLKTVLQTCLMRRWAHERKSNWIELIYSRGNGEHEVTTGMGLERDTLAITVCGQGRVNVWAGMYVSVCV